MLELLLVLYAGTNLNFDPVYGQRSPGRTVFHRSPKIFGNNRRSDNHRAGPFSFITSLGEQWS